MLLSGRSYSADNYRFGFNGKENDNEVKGTGIQQDYGMRIYDTRLNRFLSVDPITSDYPMLSPYQFASLNPIKYIDIDGLEGADIKYESGYSFQMVGRPGNLKEYNTAYAKYTGDDAILSGMAFEVAGAAIGNVLGSLWTKFTNFVKPSTIETTTIVKNESKTVQEVVTSKQTLTKAQQLAKNKIDGAVKEKLVKKQLEGELKSGEELLDNATYKLPNGKTSKPDFTIVNKSDKTIKKILDAKAGKSPLTPNQKELEELGGTLTGKRAGQYKGSSTPPIKIETR